MKLIFNECRKRILTICEREPSSIKDLALELDLNPGSIHNHVKKLFDAGYLVISETRMINGIEEKKYIKAAQMIKFAELSPQENQVRNKYIAKEIGKEVLRTLDEGEVFAARMYNVYVSKKVYKEACKRLESLIDYLQDNNNSGKTEVNFTSCLGEIK